MRKVGLKGMTVFTDMLSISASSAPANLKQTDRLSAPQDHQPGSEEEGRGKEEKAVEGKMMVKG